MVGTLLSGPPDAAGAPQPYSFQLFGRFSAEQNQDAGVHLETRKIKEIVSYLLLFRDRPHQREVLAGMLWGSSSRVRSRRNLRQALWQLRQSPSGAEREPLLLVDKEWIQINHRCIWLDVAELESSFQAVCSIPGERLDDEQARSLAAAAELYRGDLLEGWQEDWCVFERERLEAIYLGMLEKLLGYCEAGQRHEEGLVYGERLLRHDRAHERAYWRIMRLTYLAGDRTGAIRQFHRCREALAEELGVEPGRLVHDLYEQICADAAELGGAGPGS